MHKPLAHVHIDLTQFTRAQHGRISEKRLHLLQYIAAQSPIAWAQINVLGEYDFSEEKLCDTLGILSPKMTTFNPLYSFGVIKFKKI